ncbi:MAG: hypothetical protein LH645_05035 [Actinomycetia bacterium]|nr:hypothetical protein [Actinomycetes bacterium]
MGDKGRVVWWVAVGTVVAVALVAAGVAALLMRSANDYRPEAGAYGPGVDLLERWWDAGTRGDLVADPDVVATVERATRTAMEDLASGTADDPSSGYELGGPSQVAFAIDTPEGAFGYGIQHATSLYQGQTNIVPDVSLPVGVAVWLDKDGEVIWSQEDPPISQMESATGPGTELTAGAWSSPAATAMVLLDTGYPMTLTPGVLDPGASSAADLVPVFESQPVEFGDAGFSVVELAPDVVPGTANITIDRPENLSNSPALLGTRFDWALHESVSSPGGEHVKYQAIDALTLDFESVYGSNAVTIPGTEVAIPKGQEAERAARDWVRGHASLEIPRYLSSGPLQGLLPSGDRVLVISVGDPGTAYVAVVIAADGGTTGERCETTSDLLTVACRLPGGQGWVFATDDPFTWSNETYAAALGAVSVGQKAHGVETRAAVVEPGSVVRVTPEDGKPMRISLG